jgi:hypothetical protein
MPKLKNTTELANRQLEPLIKHCSKNRGSIAEVCRLYNEGLSEPIRVTTIRRWLSEDPQRRTEPLAGAFVRLLTVWVKIKSKSA